MLDRDLSPSRRVKALDRVPAGEEDEATVWAMWRIVWSDRQPHALRVACMDRLIARDAETFWAAAATNLVSIDSPAMLDTICRRVIAGRRTDMSGPLVRSLARPSARVPDQLRPEAVALAALAKDHDPQPVLWAMLSHQAADRTLAEQAAAWVVLCRVSGVEAATETLVRDHGIGTPKGLGRILLGARGVLAPLPSTREGILWLVHLETEAVQDDWSAFAAPHASWSPATRAARPLSLRHLAAIRHASADELDQSGQQLREQIGARLQTRPFHPRGLDEEQEIYVAPLQERFSDHAEGLSWADLLVLGQVLDALDQPGVLAELFAQADRDLADATREHGGALLFDARGRVRAEPFLSRQQANDRVFISSHPLVEAMYTGLAHYHFHAQKHDNAPYAGPGPGDLAFARNMGFTCLAFTFVGQNTLAADYYQPDGVAIDLGVIRRP